jgi:hypothetical protein
VPQKAQHIPKHIAWHTENEAYDWLKLAARLFFHGEPWQSGASRQASLAEGHQGDATGLGQEQRALLVEDGLSKQGNGIMVVRATSLKVVKGRNTMLVTNGGIGPCRLVETNATYMPMKLKRGGKIMVKNAVKTVIVFSKTSWIGTKAENPEEKPLPKPEGV